MVLFLFLGVKGGFNLLSIRILEKCIYFYHNTLVAKSLVSLQ